jgi:hypothetical protein
MRPASELFSLHHGAIIRAEMNNESGEHQAARAWLHVAATYRAALVLTPAADRAAALRQISYPIRCRATACHPPAAAVALGDARRVLAEAA